MARILVIDDEQQVREVIGRILERLGHEVAIAQNGEEGLELYQDQSADLVISDVFMPGKDGLDTLIALRRHDPDAKILLISGNWQRLCVDAGHLAEHLGAMGILEKPFGLKDIALTVEAALTA